MSYTLIEGCCGTAALSLYLSGINKPLSTYQGSKWKYRKELESILIDNGFIGKPNKIELYDPGPWSRTLSVLNKEQDKVIAELKKYQKEDPKSIFLKLNKNKISKEDYKFCAEFLFLQRLAFSGKAVGHFGGYWESPGFNHGSAYGIKATEKFGEIKPLINSLIQNLEKSNFGQLSNLTVGNFLPFQNSPVKNTVLYLDPPYSTTTKYPDGDLDRKSLVALAENWYQSGATVLISEAEPLPELQEWRQICLSKKKINKSSFKNKKEEWLTISPSLLDF